MSTQQHTPSRRPWYCPDEKIDSYKTDLRNGGDPTVIQTAKVLRTISLNIIIAWLTFFLVTQGGEPTTLGMGAFALLGVVNGFEYSDWVAFRTAMQETKRTE